MGWKISWVGFSGLTKAEVLDLVGATDTGEIDEANEADFSGAEIPDWYILFSNDFDFVSESTLSKLSSRGTVVGCQLHEGVMVSAAYGYDRGNAQWSVMHNAQDGISDLSTSGAPPTELEPIRERLSQQQYDAGGEVADVDYIFDIPVELAAAICGYRHDRLKFDWGEPKFTALDVR